MGETCTRLPFGDVTVKVAFILNATLTGIPMSRFAKPSIRGLEEFNAVPSFSFFIEHPSGRRILFDLGVRKDWWNLAPVMAGRIRDAGWKADVVKDVPEILEENGVSLRTIDTVIWSHWHWDHIGDMSKFPTSTNLLTGPGFIDNFVPGYPKSQKSPIRESDYSGRKLAQVAQFEEEIAGLPAHDFFGDGSFYILSTPGHAVGHLSALARTTSCQRREVSDTFILMGGDCCHHMGQMRPSILHPLPCDVSLSVISGSGSSDRAFERSNVELRQNGMAVPFLGISNYPHGESAAADPRRSVISLEKLISLDCETVLVAIAHDKTLLDVVDLFPTFSNDWKARGWAERARWLFLRDFQNQ